MNKVTGCLVALVVLLGSSCSQQDSQVAEPLENVTIAAYAGDSGALVYIAEEQGFFKKNGLQVTIKDFEAGKLATDFLLSGQADISTATDFVLTSQSFKHTNLCTLGTISTARLNELIVRKDRGIRSSKDLKGKRIGVTRKSAGEFFLGRFLTFNGLSINDVHLIDFKPSEIVAALVEGRIDAGLTWEPNIYNLKKRMADAVLSWPAQSQQDFFFILISSKQWVDAHKDTARRFLKALAEAEDHAAGDRAGVQEFLRLRFGYDTAYIEYSMPKHEFKVMLPQTLLLSMEDQARWRISNGLTETQQMPNYLNYIYYEGLKQVRPDAVTLIH